MATTRKINKSDVMKRAWKIFRAKGNPYSYCFSDALERAWYVEKETIAYELRLQAEAEEKARMAERRNKSILDDNHTPEFYAGLLNYYGTPNRYYGD